MTYYSCTGRLVLVHFPPPSVPICHFPRVPWSTIYTQFRISFLILILFSQSLSDPYNLSYFISDTAAPNTLGWQESSYLDAFGELVSQGKAIQIGVSNYGPQALLKTTQYMQRSCGVPIRSNQVTTAPCTRILISIELSLR